MPTWNEILSEVATAGSTFDVIRRRYLKQLHEVTGRNVIIYYSGWLQKPDNPTAILGETDKNGFMAAIHSLDRTKGLDLLLHTPGGDVAATESLVFYLHEMFGGNIRAIIPQIAMSAGTMIALACKQIVMGKHSSLGPIDPQFNGLSAHGILEEFKRAHKEFQDDNSRGFVWQPIISKYHPTLIGDCEKAIRWAEEMVFHWLTSCMFADKVDKVERANQVIKELGDHALTKAHNRRISVERVKELGINVSPLEEDQTFQEAVMSVHHACMLTFDRTPATKIVENHIGIAYVSISGGQILMELPK